MSDLYPSEDFFSTNTYRYCGSWLGRMRTPAIFDCDMCGRLSNPDLKTHIEHSSHMDRIALSRQLLRTRGGLDFNMFNTFNMAKNDTPHKQKRGTTRGGYRF